MGDGIGIKCGNCDYSEKFYLGCGRSDCYAEGLQRNIFDYIATDDEKSAVKILLKKGHVFDYRQHRLLEAMAIAGLKKMKKADRYDIDKIPLRAADFGYMVNYCPVCDKIYSKFAFTIRAGDEFYSYDHICPDCRVPLMIIRKTIPRYQDFPIYENGKPALNDDGTPKMETETYYKFDFSVYNCPCCKQKTLEEFFWGLRWD